MNKIIRKLRHLLGRKEEREMTRGDLIIKAAQGSAHAVRHHNGALDRLAEYDKIK